MKEIVGVALHFVGRVSDVFQYAIGTNRRSGCSLSTQKSPEPGCPYLPATEHPSPTELTSQPNESVKQAAFSEYPRCTADIGEPW